MSGFREAKEIHQASLRLGGLEAVHGGLRDSEDVILTEVCLLQSHPLVSARLYRCLCTIVYSVLTTQDAWLAGRFEEMTPAAC